MNSTLDVLTEMNKELMKCAPMERHIVVAGYASHFDSREKALQSGEVKSAIATFKDEPENFLEIAESRLAEINS